MRICDDLRQAVLQAAIQGKLTNQLPEDGNAADLLKQIKDEKAKLIKEKKINKEKEMSLQKSKRDKDFDIPDNWAWAHFGEITINLDSVRVPIEKSIREKQKNKIYDYYGASGIIDKVEDYLFDKRLLLIGEDGANLLARSTPIAFIAEGKYWVNNHAHVLDVGKYLLLDYICLYINAIDLSYYVTGTALPKMNQANMNSIWVSIPPLAEQHRIIARVEELMARIDDLEKTETELEKLKAAFPSDMKAALLQAAMQGKLTEQLPGESLDEITSHLVYDERIESPKEIPFDIPDNWQWIQIGNLGQSTDTNSFSDGPFGSNLKREHQINKSEVRIIQLSNIGETGWKNDNEKYTSFKHLEDVIPRCEVLPGDLVIAKMMPAGRTIEVPDLGTRITLGSDAMKFKPNNILNKRYLLYAMRSQAFLGQVYADAHGITRVRTTLKGIKSYVLPIPPLAEQKRIVEKLDKLLPLCDGLVEE